MEQFWPDQYRFNHFFIFKVEIPDEARTGHTSFLFKQSRFQAARDHWALDNVRILRYLPSDWNTNSGYAKNKKIR